MNSTNKESKKQRNVRQQTGIVTAYQTVTNKVYLIGLCTLAIIAPFVHIPVLYSDFENLGIAGYSFMSSFFSATGWPTTLICVGLLFKYAQRFSVKAGISFFKLLSLIFIMMGVYFLGYALIPMPSHKDLPVWAYFSLLGICSAIAGGMIYSIPDANAKLKAIIRFWMSYLINDIPQKLPEQDKAAYYEELNRKMEDSL